MYVDSAYSSVWVAFILVLGFRVAFPNIAIVSHTSGLSQDSIGTYRQACACMCIEVKYKWKNKKLHMYAYVYISV